MLVVLCGSHANSPPHISLSSALIMMLYFSRCHSHQFSPSIHTSFNNPQCSFTHLCCSAPLCHSTTLCLYKPVILKLQQRPQLGMSCSVHLYELLSKISLFTFKINSSMVLLPPPQSITLMPCVNEQLVWNDHNTEEADCGSIHNGCFHGWEMSACFPGNDGLQTCFSTIIIELYCWSHNPVSK